MCIRDRLKDTYGGNDIIVGGWGMSGSDSGNAVSYTHLDVYKRQVDVHNGSSRSGTRTYDVYAADVTIDASTTADILKAIPLTESLYQAPGVPQGQTRTDNIGEESIRDYVKNKLNTEETSVIQFAFSNSSQALDINPVSYTHLF